VFAAPAIHHGFPEAQAYYLGKVLECASFCAEPYGGKETVLGEVTQDDVRVTAMHPEQRCTVASVAGHAMYERSSPYYEHVAGGTLDMSECATSRRREDDAHHGREVPARRGVSRQARGGGPDRRALRRHGRHPRPVHHRPRRRGDRLARDKVRERFGAAGYELHYTVYGRDGIMGELEPMRDRPAHELCILVQGVAPTVEMAEEVCMTGTRQMFYARLPEVKGSAGSVAFALDEVLRASPAHRWTLNHTLRCEHPMELFRTEISSAGI
jgi:hypothetical protein